jgi:hypothetical protein
MIGVCRKLVKATPMIELPEFSALTITQSAVKQSKKQYETLDQLTIIVPQHPANALFRSLPQGAQLHALYARAAGKEDKSVSTRLNNSRATAVTLAAVPVGNSFSLLTWARKLIATSLRHGPRKIGILTTGLEELERRRALSALVAAAEAAAFDLPSFKSSKNGGAKNKLSSIQILGASPPRWKRRGFARRAICRLRTPR